MALFKLKRDGGKKKAAPPQAVKISKDGRLVYSGPVSGLPVCERVILAKSVEFFGDPEPCYIHRSAVQARLYAEFDAWLERPEGRVFTMDISEIPQNFMEYFFSDE